MKLATILAGIVIVAITLLSASYVAAADTASLDIHSAVKLAPKDMQDTETYYILCSEDMTNWTFLMGKVTTVGANIHVETGGDSVVIVDGADSQTSIFIDTEHQQKQFYQITKSPPSPEGMVLVPGGAFKMGDHYGVGDSDELPVHAVYISSFYMDRYEVTNQQYCDYLNSYPNQIEVRNGGEVYAVGGNNIYCMTHERSPDSRIYWNGNTFTIESGKENHPMVMVSWYGAQAYAQFIGKRLPTEAEWEYASRGGQQDPYYKYPWGNNIDGSNANYFNSGDPYDNGTTPVGYYSPNGYGLYDMAGNVYEWCNDWYSSSYYSTSPYSNPQGPGTNTSRVIRGGYWNDYVSDLRSAYRRSSYPLLSSSSIGFRCVWSAE